MPKNKWYCASLFMSHENTWPSWQIQDFTLLMKDNLLSIFQRVQFFFVNIWVAVIFAQAHRRLTRFGTQYKKNLNQRGFVSGLCRTEEIRRHQAFCIWCYHKSCGAFIQNPFWWGLNQQSKKVQVLVHHMIMFHYTERNCMVFLNQKVRLTTWYKPTVHDNINKFVLMAVCMLNVCMPTTRVLTPHGISSR